MTTRQTLRDFLSSIGSTTTSISMTIDTGSNGIPDPGDDLGVEPGTGRQLLDVKTGESLLGDYLSYVTKRNEYPIAPGVHEAVSPIRGASLSAAETTSAIDVFASSRVSDNAASLNRSNSTRFDASGQPLTTIIDKLATGAGPSGNELLSSTVAAKASSDVAPKQTTAVIGAFSSLKKYNRYSPTSTPSNYAKDDTGNSTTPDTFEDTRQTSFQVRKGEYSPEISEISKEIDLKDLSNVARSIILKSAGWDESTIPGDSKDPNTAFDGVSYSTLARFPEFSRDNLGVVDAFRARDAYGIPANPDGTSVLADRGDILVKDYNEANYTKTNGSSYTPDMPFGENPTLSANFRIQSLQAGLSMIGLAALIEKKLVNMNQIVKDLQTSSDEVLRGPYFMGQSTKSNLSAKTRALIRTFMEPTGIYSYEKCVAEGIYSCFGINIESDIATSIPDNISTSNIATAYGQHVLKIANDLNKPFYDSPMGLSQGFWRAVSESAIRIIKDMRRSTQASDGVDYARCLTQMKDSLVVKVMNVFASIGYQRLTIQGITTVELQNGAQPQNPFDIDGYTNTPGTRQMKSRDGLLLSRSSLAWRNSAIPSAFLLPLETMKATLDANYTFNAEKGANPIKGMLGSTLYDKTYVKSTKTSGIIPPVVAQNLEDRLGAEYLPLYIRDLRTNEIVGLQGFLTSFADGFGVSYSESKGFGRSESVYNYSSTTRTMSLSFMIVASSKEDFDEMWFKINKLTTLVYPQYTQGRIVQTDSNSLVGKGLNEKINFEQPFSQLAGGTPVVRIRVGDLFKTNYTRSNLGRLFGVGNSTFKATSVDDTAKNKLKDFGRSLLDVSWADQKQFFLPLAPFLLYAGSPMELLQFTTLIKGGTTGGLAGALGNGLINSAASFVSNALVNGFVNPLIYENRSVVINKPRQDFSKPRNDVNTFAEWTGIKARGILKPRATPYLITDKDKPRKLRVLRPIFVTLTGIQESEKDTAYQVKIDDASVGDELQGVTFKVSTADLYIDSGRMVDITSIPGVLLALGAINAGTLASAAESATNRALTEVTNIPVNIPFSDLISNPGSDFIAPENNPITRAFEERMGEGIAGVITSLGLDWSDHTWETDWNSRAPISCKISISFKPIHDIAPGLDANGFNRAPIYNVGNIMHDSFGSPRPDGGAASRFFYKRGGAIAETAQNPTSVNDFFEKNGSTAKIG